MLTIKLGSSSLLAYN